jgi:hypothetical protein
MSILQFSFDYILNILAAQCTLDIGYIVFLLYNPLLKG